MPETVTVTTESSARPSALASLAAIMVRPRVTMRRILDAGPDRMIVPLILLASLSSVLGDVDRAALESLRKTPLPVHYSLVLAGICLGAGLIFLLFFYLFSWIVYGMSRILEGTASPREVRSALAWGVVPIIWSILYRLPAAVLWPGATGGRMRMGSEPLTFNPEVMGTGCVGAVIFGVLELTMLVWYLVVTSNTIAEANRFSTGRGFGTIVLTSITPIVIAVAAFLAT